MISRLNSRTPLRLKLIGAFAIIILLGGATAYWLAQRAVREGYQSFSAQSGIIHAYELQQPLAEYYTRNGSWRRVENFLTGMGSGMMQTMSPAMLLYHYNLILTDEDGKVLLAPDSRLLGRRLSEDTLIAGVPINAGGRRIGTLLAGSAENAFSPLEQAFLDSVSRSTLIASVVAALAALVVGALLLRQVTGPLRQLARATKQIASGDPGPRLPAKAKDELGQLSIAFNQMAERLEKSEQLRRQLIADIAHELRTPLTVIQGNLEAMRAGAFAPTPEAISSLHEESIILTRLVNDLRELSLVQAGELSLQKQLTDISMLTRRTAASFQPQIDQKKIQLALQVPGKLPSLKIDPHRISQVLVNLLSNALHHTPIGGQITITIQETPSELQISVADTGPGIAPDDLPHVFERFWRADQSRSRLTSGSGLGLAIAKQLVEAHGGRIWVEDPTEVSQNTLTGATFIFTLPLMERKAA
jgi:signal transduction histidine kinase